MPTQNPVGDTTGYTTFTVQPLVYLTYPTVQPLNKNFILKTPFTMTGVYQVPSVLLPGDWAVKLDLAHGKIFNLDRAVLTLNHSLLSCANQSVPSEVSKIYLEGESL